MSSLTIPPLETFTDKKHFLAAIGTWRKSVHAFDPRSAQAIRAALASGRPLLVRGEPGTGKSQLARAAAKVLGRKFLCQVVDGQTEVQDLWYRFDAVSRLGHAQMLSVTKSGVTHKFRKTNVETALNPSAYLSPGILWWTFDWDSASQHNCKHRVFQPDDNDTDGDLNGVVLLLDEIDKADADLPNSLLETLDNGKFHVPWLHKTIGADPDNGIPRPLVIITTNEDRQLPAAFVRRCLVLDLNLPDDEKLLTKFLKERAILHFPAKKQDSESNGVLERDPSSGQLKGKSRFTDKVLNMVTQQLHEDRRKARSLGVTPPGQAEFIDILRVLDELAHNDTPLQIKLLKTVNDFAFKKYPGMQKAHLGELSDD
jgi:MoxR-like ATPase